jgi:ATP-grasp domain, R2K clade family 3
VARPSSTSLVFCGCLHSSTRPKTRDHEAARYGTCRASGCHDVGVLLILPSDPLEPRKPDEHFAAEAAAARSLGVDVALIDHDALTVSGPASEVIGRVPPDGGDAVYRGWMVTSLHYRRLADALAAKRVSLRTTPDSYQAAHEPPGWFVTFRDHTARSVWLDDPNLDGLDQALGQLPAGPAIVKSYVKSMKHYWSEATYIPDVRDLEGARAVVRRFLELRGEELVGGVVVRSFEEFQPGEARTWWIKGRCQLATAHPDTPLIHPGIVPTDSLAKGVSQLGNPFVTVDMVQAATGGWRVVEAGGGQVSDRPEGASPTDLIGALAACRPVANAGSRGGWPTTESGTFERLGADGAAYGTC